MGEDIYYRSPDGLKLYAKRYGTTGGMPVLCMHGLTRNHRDFEPLIEALPKKYDILAVDQRGRGKSEYDADLSNYRPDVYIKDMEMLLNHLGVRKAHLIGTSMGGLMSMLMMKAMPQRVASVVMNDIGPVLEKAGLQRIAGYVGGTEPVDGWEEAVHRTKAVQLDAFPKQTDAFFEAFARRTWTEDEAGKVRLDYDPKIADSLSAIKTGAMINFMMWRLFDEMKQVPLLLIRGGLTDLLSPANAERMVKRHPNAQLVTVPDVGHAPILNEPDAQSAILAFLKKQETAA